jgi:hypothetical protein
MLIDERPIMFLPKLAKALGSCEKAIVLQQIHWLSTQPNSGKVIDGTHWVWGTYEEWCRDYFTMWTPRTLKMHIQNLEKQGVLISAQLRAHEHDQTKFYRINYNHELLSLTGMGHDHVPSSGQNITPPTEHHVPSIEHDHVPSKEHHYVLSKEQHPVPSIYGTETPTKTPTKIPTEKGNDASDDAPPFDDWEEFVDELCFICHGHKETTSLTAKDIGALRAEGKKIIGAGFGIADLRDWMTGVWFKDWRWKKDQQRPTPAQVRSSIAKVRAEMDDEAARRREYSKYNSYREPTP